MLKLIVLETIEKNIMFFRKKVLKYSARMLYLYKQSNMSLVFSEGNSTQPSGFRIAGQKETGP